jgi:methyl-accepting chemotaxis protein
MFFLAELVGRSSWTDVALAALVLFTAIVNSPWFANRSQAKELKQHSDKGREEIKKEIVDKVEQKKGEISSKIEENTELSKQAFSDANHFNEKILAVTTEIGELAAKIERLDKHGTSMSVAGFSNLASRLDKIEQLLIHPPGPPAVTPVVVKVDPDGKAQ